MMDNGHDPLTGALGQLTVAPPEDLLARVVAGWVKVPAALGELYVAFTDRGISYVRIAESIGPAADAWSADEIFCEDYRRRFGRPLRRAERPPAGVLPALRGRRAGSLRFDLRGLTEFERDVLEATLRIPHGQTRPYAWVAREIGRPRAVRAVGSALGRNPVPLLIPCHRVTRSDGNPGEYVFGARTKEALLRAEHVDLDEVRELAAAGVFFVGSDTTGIACFPTCHHARRIGAGHRRGFRSMAQAVDAGYRPCRHCRPVLADSA
ncbi:MAG: methylated-DNA--[protein]-cysteine S-methyltransferase [Frankiaceae bacterium]